jgi:hypothetical protein
MIGDFVALIQGLDESQAEEQANHVLSLKPDEKLLWQKRLYMYPSTLLHIPHTYAAPLDVFLSVSAPTTLRFPGAPNGTVNINPSCVWESNGGVFCCVRNIPYYLDEETGLYHWPDGLQSSYVYFFHLSAKEHHQSPGAEVVVKNVQKMHIPEPIEKAFFHYYKKPNSALLWYITGGYEDMRLIRVVSHIIFVCVCVCVCVCTLLFKHRFL